MTTRSHQGSFLARDKEAEEMRTMEDDFKTLKKDLDARYVELRDQVKTLQQKTAKTVTERPLLALGVAFVVGMAFGIALSGSRD
jgi:ElaB/YqjD/DUF883 family membrane-anchored ribosome-binding protein